MASSYLFIGQRNGKHFFYIFHIVESQSFQINFLYLFNVLTILVAEDNLL